MLLMKECLFTFRVALILQKDSVLYSAVSDTIQRTTEAGLIAKWTRDAMEETAHLVDSSGNGIEANEPWTVADLQVSNLHLKLFCFLMPSFFRRPFCFT